MTKPTDVSTAERPASQRLPFAIVLVIAGMFLVGVGAGVIVALIAKGGVPASKLWLLAVPAVALPAGIVALRKAYRLALPPSDASNFERRYWRMWMWVFILGAPLGMALAFPSLGSGKAHDFGSLLTGPFSNAPLPSDVAIAVTLVGLVLCVAAFLMYHRTIDEQEERGYLWGSQIAYYFLSLAFPAWWVLQRGGLLTPMTAGLALALVLFSFVIQAAVWAWFKFR